jgi:hypothetical protein
MTKETIAIKELNLGEQKLSPSQIKDKMIEYYSKIINEELCFVELKTPELLTKQTVL